MSTALRMVAFVFLAAAGPAAAQDLDITITHPAAGRPVFDEIEVMAEVTAAEAPIGVELFVDGRSAGRLDEPPYRWRVNVGSENREHLFEVVARTAAGGAESASVLTPGIRVDLEVELQLQQLYLTAIRGDEPVLDLERGDFVVLDNGKRQEIVTFERGDIPLTVLLMVDASVSMRGRPLEAALRGAGAFIDGMKELDRAKLLLFSDRVIKTTPFTGFGAVLATGLAGVEAAGGTALNDHLYLALRLLEERQGRRVIVLLTDGVDVASVLGLSDVEWAAQRGEAMIYWIRLGNAGLGRHFSSWRDDDGHRQEHQRLERLVEKSGGRILSLASIEDAETAFADVLRELREQYVLGYYPSRNRDDGAWHRLRIRVERPGVNVRVREGYLDR